MKGENNLWPTIELERIRTPKSILNEQATYLSQMTQNVVLGHTESLKTNSPASISFGFKLVAPSLDNYEIDLLTIQHNLTKLFPVTIIFHLKREKTSYRCEDEEAYKNKLKAIFSDKETQKIIQSLYAQSIGEE